MIRKKQKIWRENFSILNCHYQMATPAGFDMFNYQPAAFRGILKEMIWIQQDDNNISTYFPVDQLRKFIEHIIKVIETKPDVVNKMHRETANYTNTYFKVSAISLKLDLKKISTKELIKKYQEIINYQMIHHGWAISTTWFVDSDNEDFSKLLIKKAESLVKGSSYKMADIFSTLTTPIKPSLAMKEELAAWHLVNDIFKNKKARTVFMQKDASRVEAGFDMLPLSIKKRILAHYQKWRWQPFTYIGPAYELNYYLALWSGWLKEGMKPAEKIKELSGYPNRIRQEKATIIRNLKIKAVDRELFKIASDIIYLKALRKDALFFGMYALDMMLKEISARLHLSLSQTRALAYWEVPSALRQGYFTEDILNDRRKFSVFYQKGAKGVIYIGVSARKFLNSINIEKKVIKQVSELFGTVACPGKIRGLAKIINITEEMSKMNKGDIMIAHTTFPSLVPAMKKAAAIVTDDGGITCHAAIVSRELKTPCVVGTKIATKILKDGDLIEVDARKGIVRLLKKKKG